MEEEKKSVDNASAETQTEEASTLTAEEERIAELEAENAKLVVESANYKLGMLKAKGKAVAEDFGEETEEERIARIVQEKLAETKILQNNAEKDALIKKALRENKELKLALNNKTKDPSATIGTHSEGPQVKDTSITPEQLSAFKAKGWTEKDIERYKKNLSRYVK